MVSACRRLESLLRLPTVGDHDEVGHRRLFLLATWIALAHSGCRFSYEILEGGGVGISEGDGDGDGNLGGSSGDGDISSGGNSSGGSSSGGNSSGGNPGDGGTMGNYHVDSALDPAEAGKTTLRDAILAANSAAGSQSITFQPALTIQVSSEMEPITDSVTIYGDGTHLDFSMVGSNQDCMTVSGGTVLIDSIEVTGCADVPILFSGGTGHQLARSFLHDNDLGVRTDPGATDVVIGPDNRIEGGLSYALFLNGPGGLIHDNTFVETGGSNDSAVLFAGGGDNCTFLGNLVIRSTNGIQTVNGSASIDIYHNTFVGTLNDVISVGGPDIDIRNNVISHSGGYGIIGDAPNISALDYNLFFQNANGDCNDCGSLGGVGANSITGQDPLYVDFAGDDFGLQSTSPAVDEADPAVAADRNGSAAGNYNAAAPDMGAFESE